jgi:ATP-dependent Clp protease, protease subunit
MEVWIRFMATLTPQTAATSMKAIDQRLSEGMSHLHLMISSPGGSVFHGLSLHNFLKGIGIEVSTYNFGSVDSIGVVVSCAGSKRYCVPNSRFHIHGIKLNFKGEGIGGIS